MHRPHILILAFLLPLLSLVACSGKPEKVLVGDWVVDKSAMLKSEFVVGMKDGMSPEAMAAAMERLDQEMGKTTLSITETTLVATTAKAREEATYKVQSATKGEIVVVTTDASAKADEYTFRAEGDRLTMRHGEETVIFRRR
ncbi:MAG: hypothetical protein EXR76_03495 [Myxococcales bacterium]|nr:hypothetical protein [Myxococcales bacterium]